MTQPVSAALPSEEQFLLTHPSRGSLRIQISAVRGAFPVPNAIVTVSRTDDGVSRLLYRGRSDSSGIWEVVSLPALPGAYSLAAATAENSGTDYQVSVTHPSFEPVSRRSVTVYSDIETILPVTMEPITRI